MVRNKERISVLKRFNTLQESIIFLLGYSLIEPASLGQPNLLGLINSLTQPHLYLFEGGSGTVDLDAILSEFRQFGVKAEKPFERENEPRLLIFEIYRELLSVSPNCKKALL